jgi:hypothetical protein
MYFYINLKEDLKKIQQIRGMPMNIGNLEEFID